MGADTKANTRELVRGPDGLLERLQCRVAPETLRESGSSFGAEVVSPQTAWWSAEVVWCQRALTQRQTLRGGALQRGQTALWETRSESHDAREVHHLYVSIAVRRLADGHFATLISHLGSDLEGRALYLALIDVTRLVNQVVASKTVWEQEHEGEL